MSEYTLSDHMRGLSTHYSAEDLAEMKRAADDLRARFDIPKLKRALEEGQKATKSDVQPVGMDAVRRVLAEQVAFGPVRDEMAVCAQQIANLAHNVKQLRDEFYSLRGEVATLARAVDLLRSDAIKKTKRKAAKK